MAFDPLADEPQTRDLPSDEVAATARSAAADLVVELGRAKTRSDGWQNAHLAQLLIDHALSECLNRLAATGCWGEANRAPSDAFWQQAGPMLEAGSLQWRARSKPLGYAGDHVMLRRIWEQSCCDDPVGRLFDRYFLSLAAPQAVRARMQHVAGTFAARLLSHHGPEYRVVSVGAGPAIDLELGLAAVPSSKIERTRIRLVDIDPGALEGASERIGRVVSPENLTSCRENLFRLAARPSAVAEAGGADLLICTGLFDYLADDVAVEMLRLFWRCLDQGGQMLVGNFAPHNPTRAYMEWIGNWYLIYRTADDLRRLGGLAGIPNEQMAIQVERTGVDLFMVATKAR